MMIKKIPLPNPVTLHAILTNNLGIPTEHTFLETRACEVVLKDDSGRQTTEPAYEFIFVCTLTKAERRWGLVDRFEFDKVAN